METIHAKLVASREDVGDYTIYVFQNLETSSYAMVTKLPRWDSTIINIGDTGFLKYEEVIAGKDTWFNYELGKQVPYKYTGVYFRDFVKDLPKPKKLIL